MGRLRPHELVWGHALAGFGHAGEAQIGTIGKGRCQQGGFINVDIVSAQISEACEKASLRSHIVK